MPESAGRESAQTDPGESQSRLTSAATNQTDYPALFTAAFGSPEITPEKIGLAIESFVLTLTSFDSKFDRALRGETQLTAAEQRGFELFMTEYDPRREQYGADCFHCHGGPLFQSQTFANNGLDANFADPGRAKVTGKDSDAGKFATPSLRNIALTAPYMHDGRFQTLEEVVTNYSTGMKRSATLDPNLAKHPGAGEVGERAGACPPFAKDDLQAPAHELEVLGGPPKDARSLPNRVADEAHRVVGKREVEMGFGQGFFSCIEERRRVDARGLKLRRIIADRASGVDARDTPRSPGTTRECTVPGEARSA